MAVGNGPVISAGVVTVEHEAALGLVRTPWSAIDGDRDRLEETVLAVFDGLSEHIGREVAERSDGSRR